MIKIIFFHTKTYDCHQLNLLIGKQNLLYEVLLLLTFHFFKLSQNLSPLLIFSIILNGKKLQSADFYSEIQVTVVSSQEGRATLYMEYSFILYMPGMDCVNVFP